VRIAGFFPGVGRPGIAGRDLQDREGGKMS
jgi:hypothetical protein